MTSDADRAAVLKAIRAGTIRAPSARRASPAAGEAPNRHPAGDQWRCHRCPERFRQWAPAQRHSNDTGHHRLELILP